MQPFCRYELRDVLRDMERRLKSIIDDLPYETLSSLSFEIIAEDYLRKVLPSKLTLSSKQDAIKKFSFKRVNLPIPNYLREIYKSGKREADAIEVLFELPFSGDIKLLDCRASHFIMSGYPELSINNGFLVIAYVEEISNGVSHESIVNKIEASFSSDYARLAQGIGFINDDLDDFVREQKKRMLILLSERKSKQELAFKIAAELQATIEEKKPVITINTVQPKATIKTSLVSKVDNGISEEEFCMILETIKDAAMTYERTPNTYSQMGEEDLRNTLLSTLNAIYKGSATGETFRKHGKTDICIEKSDRSAFVAECKIWSGKKGVDEAIKQLMSYLTWRDSKVALVLFSRNRSFANVVGELEGHLKALAPKWIYKKVSNNDCEIVSLPTKEEPKAIKIRVLVFDISVKQ